MTTEFPTNGSMRRVIRAAAALLSDAKVPLFVGATCIALSCGTRTPTGRPEPFGVLPPDPIAKWELGDVRAEVVFFHLVDPSLLVDQVPAGLIPVPLRERAKRDAAAAAFLARRPEYAEHVFGGLGFVALDTMRLDGSPLGAKASKVVVV